MIRFFLLATLLFSTGCAQRFDVFTSWTVGGLAPENACESLRAPGVRFRILSRETQNGDPVESQTTVDCSIGTAKLSVGPFADVFVDLVDEDITFGTAGAFELAPVSGVYDGETAADPLNFDIDIDRGRVRAELLVLGKNCGDAGASAFTVSMTRNTAPLGEEVVVEDTEVGCDGGTALFEPEVTVEIGSRYDIVASTTIDGENFATDSSGEGFTPALLFNVVSVDLQAAP